MADKEVVSTTVTSNPDDESTRPHPNPFVSIISNFTHAFKSLFPPPQPPPSPPASAKKDVVKERKVGGDAVFDGSEVVVVVVEEESKPVTVRFPAEASTTTTAVDPPLKLESEEVKRDNKPVVIWQVYAIGGFFILKWALGRWKERRTNKKPSDQDSPPAAPAAND